MKINLFEPYIDESEEKSVLNVLFPTTNSLSGISGLLLKIHSIIISQLMNKMKSKKIRSCFFFMML